MFSNNTLQNISFLDGGGEMGKLIREKDWSKTSLGNADNWPQSLRTSGRGMAISPAPPPCRCQVNDTPAPSP